MASTKEYLDFVIEQLSGMDEISYRVMMGEYILYYRGRVFGGIYDGTKEMIPVDDVDNREFLCKLVESMWEELPEGKGKNSEKP